MPGTSQSQSEHTDVVPELMAFPCSLYLAGKGVDKEIKCNVLGKRKCKGLILLQFPFFAALQL